MVIFKYVPFTPTSQPDTLSQEASFVPVGVTYVPPVNPIPSLVDEAISLLYFKDKMIFVSVTALSGISVFLKNFLFSLSKVTVSVPTTTSFTNMSIVEGVTLLITFSSQ